MVFQLCFDADPRLYRSMLAASFSPAPVKPVYKRFLQAVRQIEGASIVTTNVDEMLERSLPEFELVQRSDTSRAIELLSSNIQFIAKTHGSISAIESTVFKTDDYEALTSDVAFIKSLKHLLTACSVLFIGYGIRDKYMFDLLNENATALSLFGDGPHFLISPDRRPELPVNVNLVQYRTFLHTDHRSSILAVELVCRSKTETDSFEHAHPQHDKLPVKSAHFLSDFYPAGTWTSGQTASATATSDGRTVQMMIGPDWSVGETSPFATAAHDLAIGLISFDQVLVPLECISRVFALLGWERFEALVDDDVLQFVHWEGFDSVQLESDSIGFGCLATGKRNEGDPGDVIRRQMSPAATKVADGMALISRLEKKAVCVDLSGGRNFADVCNGLFVSPATRAILGMSQGTPAGRIPRWMAHPALRVVHIARVGAACQKLGLASMKLMTGAAKVANVAFSAIAGGILASEPSSYVLTGEYGIVAEESFRAQPSLWDTIIHFRNGSGGATLRQEVLTRLIRNDGAEIIPSMDASLRSALPASVLTPARREMSALLVANGVSHVVPAFWSDSILLQSGPETWRRGARQRLTTYLDKHGLGVYDPCPCGSYESVKFC